MCGIAGICEQGSEKVSIMNSMLEAIAHRGPDAKTFYHKDSIVVGHRRLSVIDLKTGDQPKFNIDKSLSLVFNGEIFNYRELKLVLEGEGVLFYTNSDTEVLLKGYEKWGFDIFAKLNGQFAAALCDHVTDTIILVRDHFGIKPLHYYDSDGLFIFASEQKAILAHPKVPRRLNYNALHLHLNLRYTQGCETLFTGIKRLEPGHYLIYKKGELSIRKYWQLEPMPDATMTEDMALEGINYHLKEAVRRQLVSDVPVGVYLSGGMDSSTVVQKMSELGESVINTFTLGFNEPTDENADAQLVSNYFSTNHREMNLSINALDEMESVIWHAEEPKINLIQGYNMSKFVKSHVKVVLGGLGGDELFAGYDIHKYIYPLNKWAKRIPKFLDSLLRWKSEFLFKVQNSQGKLKWDEYRRGMQMLLSIKDIERYYLGIRNVWDYDEGMYTNIYQDGFKESVKSRISKVHKEFDVYFNKASNLTPLDQVLFTEFHSKMVNDYLLVDDRMSMAHSVEERVPFLDVDLVNYCFSIPAHIKMNNNSTKYLFRKAMSSKLPKSIIEKKKWGFTVNPYIQFKKDLKVRCEDILTPSFIEEQGIFNYGYIRKILDARPDPRMRWHYNYLWIVLGLAVWQKTFDVRS